MTLEVARARTPIRHWPFLLVSLTTPTIIFFALASVLRAPSGRHDGWAACGDCPEGPTRTVCPSVPPTSQRVPGVHLSSSVLGRTWRASRSRGDQGRALLRRQVHGQVRNSRKFTRSVERRGARAPRPSTPSGLWRSADCAPEGDKPRGSPYPPRCAFSFYLACVCGFSFVLFPSLILPPHSWRERPPFSPAASP